MTLEEFEAAQPDNPQEEADVRACVIALQGSLQDLANEYGDDIATAAYLILSDALEDQVRAAMN